MLEMLSQLRSEGFAIVIVDDGSGPDYAPLFEQATASAAVLRHLNNRGKGSALRTGLAHIYQVFGPDCVVVTVDADGQHRVEDALRLCVMAESVPGVLMLGSRALRENVPLRSRCGNTITRLVYRLTTGQGIHDTQTGLRAFCGSLIPELLTIPGDRYEYEMNVLLTFSRKHILIKEMCIEAIYMNNNSGSHFSTFRDSYRVYKEIFRFSASSMVSFLLDYALYSLLLLLTIGTSPAFQLRFANVTARIISASVNYTLNRNLVFHSSRGFMRSASEYALLAAVILLGNTIVLETLVTHLEMNFFAAKLLTELIFFLFSWMAQRTLIFRRS